LAVDEPEGDLNSGEERLDSPKTYLHVRPYPDRHVRSYADSSGLLMLCGHHGRQHEAVLRRLGAVIVGELSFAPNDVPSVRGDTRTPSTHHSGRWV